MSVVNLDTTLNSSDSECPQLAAWLKYPDHAELGSLNLINHPRPSVDDFFIEEMRAIGGRDRYGDWRFQLSWGPEIFRWAFGTVWMRYICQRRETPDGFMDIGVPRFIVEEKVDSIWLMPGWSESIQGPKPVRGEYRFCMAIQDAVGNYVRPDRRYLNLLQRARFIREQQALKRHHEHAQSQAEMDEGVKQIMAAKRAEEEKEDLARYTMIHDRFKERRRRITHNLPNEGRVPDPYLVAQRHRAQSAEPMVTLA